MVNRYLVHDARCPRCLRLAVLIDEVAGGRLALLDLRDPYAITLLEWACPSGWHRAPYLITLQSGAVRARTGWRGIAHLAWLLGLSGSWTLWRKTRRAGLRLLPRAGRSDPRAGVPH